MHSHYSLRQTFFGVPYALVVRQVMHEATSRRRTAAHRRAALAIRNWVYRQVLVVVVFGNGPDLKESNSLVASLNDAFIRRLSLELGGGVFCRRVPPGPSILEVSNIAIVVGPWSS